MTTNHQKFIDEVIKGTALKEAYKLCIGKEGVSDKTCEVKGSEMAKRYAKEIEEGRKRNKDIADKANKKTLAKIAQMKILSTAERKQILSKIAKGQIPLKKPMVVKDEIIMVPIVPDWNDRKNAIAELNKMDGSYAPIKQQIETSGVIKVGYGKKEGE